MTPSSLQANGSRTVRDDRVSNFKDQNMSRASNEEKLAKVGHDVESYGR